MSLCVSTQMKDICYKFKMTGPFINFAPNRKGTTLLLPKLNAFYPSTGMHQLGCPESFAVEMAQVSGHVEWTFICCHER